MSEAGSFTGVGDPSTDPYASSIHLRAGEGGLASPVSGRLLVPDTPHSLAAAGERWPVVDGIPYLRTGRDDLVAAALAQLDAGDDTAALVTLLADQDDWWTGPATDAGELARLVRERDTLTLRDAMALLRLGPVADYFAYRWSDPTYLAGLALLEAHWSAPATAFELASGIGHYLRELTRRGVACTGADVVFAKCWLAKHWVAPDADYLVFDAASAHWPVEGGRYDLVQCHDAFYFLPDQPHAAAMLRSITAPDGVLAISHLHHRDYGGEVKGPARSAKEWRSLFPRATVYDENELIFHMGQGCDPPDPLIGWAKGSHIEAYSMVEGGPESPRPLVGGLAMPLTDARLRPNPLIGTDSRGRPEVRWPSARYQKEYGEFAYWAYRDQDLPGPADPVRLRRLMDLPERW